MLFTALLGLPGSANAAPPKLDKMLQVGAASGATGQVQVIITAVPGKRDAVRTRLYAKGRPITAEHPTINAISATVDAGDLADLAGDPSVASVSLDAPVNAHATLTGADSLVSLDLLRAMVGGTATGLTGRAVGVAIVDSGIGPTPPTPA